MEYVFPHVYTCLPSVFMQRPSSLQGPDHNAYKVLSVFEGVITLESELGVFLVIAENKSLLDLHEPGRSILADKDLLWVICCASMSN